MSKLRVVFMGTPEFAVGALRAIANDSDFEVVGVYSQPDRPTGRGQEVRAPAVKQAALALGISPIYQPEKLSLSGEFEKLSALRPDVIVVVAYGQILRKNVLDLPRLGCVNIHASLLPRWRGAAPIQWALLAGDSETGVATMRLVEKLDAGDVLLADRTSILATDNASILHDRLAEMGARLIGPTLKGLRDGTLHPLVQDETLVTYASKLSKEMEGLDATRKTAMELGCQVRALNPWPGTSVWVEVGSKRERLKVKRATSHPKLSVSAGHIGMLYEASGMVVLGTLTGALELHTLQWDGKRETDPVAFLNGLKGKGISLPLRAHSIS